MILCKSIAIILNQPLHFHLSSTIYVDSTVPGRNIRAVDRPALAASGGGRRPAACAGAATASTEHAAAYPAAV